MQAPLLGLLLDVGGEVPPLHADPAGGIDADRGVLLRDPGERMVRASLPEPIRSRLRVIAEALLTLPQRLLGPFALGDFSSQLLVDHAELSGPLKDTALELLVEEVFGAVRRFRIRPRDLLAVESMVKGGHERRVAEGDLDLGDDALKEKSLERRGEARTPRRGNDHAGVPGQLQRDPGRAQGLPGGRVREHEGLARGGLRRSLGPETRNLAATTAEIWSSSHANRLQWAAPAWSAARM